MLEYNQDELLKLFDALPKEIRVAILSENTSNSVRAIASKYGLKGQRIGEVAGLLGYTMAGLLSPLELTQGFQDATGLSSQDSQDMVNDFVAQVLYPLQDILESFYPDVRFTPEMKITKRGFQEPASTIPTTSTNQPASASEITPPTSATPTPSPASTDSYRELI
jgi:hypothetical protein